MQIICLNHVARLDQPCTVALRLFFCIESRATLLVGWSNNVGWQTCNMPKWYIQMTECIFTSKWRQQTYIWHPYIYIYIYIYIYNIYARLWLGLDGPYIGIYANIEACAQSRADVYIYIYIYIYIYTHIWILARKAKSSLHSLIRLQEAMVYNP